jgi:hypothetical protein
LPLLVVRRLEIDAAAGLLSYSHQSVKSELKKLPHTGWVGAKKKLDSTKSPSYKSVTHCVTKDAGHFSSVGWKKERAIIQHFARVHTQSLLTSERATLLHPRVAYLSRMKRVCNADGNYFQTSGAFAMGAI